MKLTDKKSIKNIIKQMSPREKLKVLSGASFFKSGAIERLQIPEIYFLDGGTGANLLQIAIEVYFRIWPLSIEEAECSDEPASMGEFLKVFDCILDSKKLTSASKELQEKVRKVQKGLEEYLPKNELPGCFPPGIVLGATWDEQNIYEMARALGKEAKHFKIDVLLGTPNVNIHRDPLNGRLFEGYSEDPCLVSKLAPEFVKGIQEEGIVANVKHFAANNQETNRRGINEIIQERALREIYFPGFKACIQNGGCGTVMSAYNKINGSACAQNQWLLQDILRNEWGFEGFVVSDWGAAYNVTETWHAGNDVVMHGPRVLEQALEAMKEGRLEEEYIDQMVEHVLSVIVDFNIGKTKPDIEIDRQCSKEAAYNSIKEGMVLLKNKNQILPLPADNKLAIFGEKSKLFIESGGGSAYVTTSESTSLLDELSEQFGKKNVEFEIISEKSDTVVITVSAEGSEGLDRRVMDLDDSEKSMLLTVIQQAKKAKKKIVVILNVCGPVDVTEYIEDVDALLCVFYPGMEGGKATADALSGKINPSGKLPVTFPVHYEDCFTSVNFPGGDKEVWYSEGIFVGYRFFDRWNIKPQFEFGYGLSYTTFSIDEVWLDMNEINKDLNESTMLSVKIKNTGNLTGKEVIQVYIGQKHPHQPKPVKELKAFKKVKLMPSEEKKIKFCLSAEDMQSYDVDLQEWICEPGNYDIYVGTSSRNIWKVCNLCVTGFNPYGFNENTSMGTLLQYPNVISIMEAECIYKMNLAEIVRVGGFFTGSQTVKEFWKDIADKMGLSVKESKEKLQRIVKNINRI